MIEPGQLEWQSIILIQSIEKFCQDDYKVFAYCRQERIHDLKKELIAFLKRKNIELVAIVNDFEPEYLYGNKLIACSQERNFANMSLFLDTDTFLSENIAFNNIGNEYSISIVPAGLETWEKEEVQWQNVYSLFKLELPQRNIMLNNGKLSYPYYNAGFILFPEKHIFKHSWLSIADKVDQSSHIPNKRPWLDQIVLPVAIEYSGLKTILLHNMYNYNANNEFSIPKTKIIHYHRKKWLYKHKLNNKINTFISDNSGFKSLYNVLQTFN